MSRLRILIADDNQLARLGVKTLLETDPGLEIVAIAASGQETLALYAKTKPDVVVLDMKMPDLDGVHVTERLLATDPGARILILTQLDGDVAISKALQAGAHGYVTKESGGDEILRGIRDVAAGLRFLPGTIAARLSESEGERTLSPRQLEILRLLARGLSNREIGGVLSISERTVNIHVTAVLEKLGASNRTEAVSIAIGRGMMDL